MFFSNLNTYSFIIFTILLLISIYLLFIIFKRKNKINKIGIIFLFLSFFISLFAIFGLKGNLKEKTEKVLGTNVAFILDVSKSMGAIDSKFKNKTRLNLSKDFINNFITEFNNNNYSLTIFTGEALNVIPFTSDLDLYKTFLYGVNDRNLSKQGTNLKEAIKIGLSNFIDDNSGVIILLTDGGEEEYSNLELLTDELKDKNISLILIGVGDLKGTNIPVGSDMFGSILYKVYNGKKVLTKLNEKVIKNISNSLNGKYFRLDNIDRLEELEEIILKEVDRKLLEKTFENRENLTRKLIIISFVFWILFLGTLFIAKLRD